MFVPGVLEMFISKGIQSREGSVVLLVHIHISTKSNPKEVILTLLY